MPKVFISYRRDDTSGYAGRINSRLERAVGQGNVFQDVADIAPGLQWDTAIAEAMAQCDIQLVLIGPRFLSEVNGPRLHQENDLLREEIAAGLRSARTRVVPVRVGGAELPTAAQLPADLARLPTRQDFELRDSSFDRDLGDLLKRLGLRRVSPVMIGAGAIGVLALVVAAILMLPNGDAGSDAAGATTTTRSAPTTTSTTLPQTTITAPEPFQLDNYVGIDADAAEASLESLGLRVQRTLTESADLPAGSVISHSPAADAEVRAGDPVTLVVSTGPPDAEVPATAGTLQDTAIQQIGRAGLNHEIVTIASGILGVDRVIRTEPPVGALVPAGSTVRILVSSGPASECGTLFGGEAQIGIDGAIPTDETGSATGFEVDLIRAVLDQMCGPGVGMSYRPLTAAERFNAVAAGEVDMLPTSQRSGTVFLLYTTPHLLRDDGTPRGLAVRDGLNTARSQLNAALLEVINSGRWLELHEQWLGTPSYSTDEMLATPLIEG